VTLLNRQAARIAGHRAATICDVSGRHVGYVQDADGLAIVGGHILWLTPQICYRIYLVKHSAQAGAGSGEAIAVFAHETLAPARTGANEAVTNCFAYQSGVSVGEALGLSPTRARQLMREQLADNPANFAATPQCIVPPAATAAAASTSTSTAATFRRATAPSQFKSFACRSSRSDIRARV
jgi:hypothetical protein